MSWQEASLVCIILQNTTTQKAVKAGGAGAQNAQKLIRPLTKIKRLEKIGANMFPCHTKSDISDHTASMERIN